MSFTMIWVGGMRVIPVAICFRRMVEMGMVATIA